MTKKEHNQQQIFQEGLQFLAQQAEYSKILWAEALGAFSPLVAKPSEKTTSAEELKRSQKSDSSPAIPEVDQSPSPDINQRKVLRPIPCPEPDPSWRYRAPEAEPTIPVPGEIEDPFPQYTSMDSFRAAICNCQKCPLGRTRTNFVYGMGDPQASLVLIGESPGADEDAQGFPFVGRAGQLLDKILAAVDLKRDNDVYIANILKCHPPENRNPRANEVEHCEPYLIKQLQLIKPKLIVSLGRIAAQILLRTTDSLAKMRGRILDYHGVPFLVTFHPAALLRNPQWKRPTWEDVQKMKDLLIELKSTDPS